MPAPRFQSHWAEPLATGQGGALKPVRAPGLRDTQRLPMRKNSSPEPNKPVKPEEPPLPELSPQEKR